MSAALASASADFTLGDVSVHLACSSPAELLQALAAFGKAPAANDTPAPAGVTPAGNAKPASTAQAPAGTSSQPQGAGASAGEQGNVGASTGTPAGAQPAASGSVPASDVPAIAYKEVSDRVLAISKLPSGRETVLGLLKGYTDAAGQPCDHGKKLQPQDYAAFIAAADSVLGVAA